MTSGARFLQKLRGASCVVRWNFHPHIRNETVAEHSFYAAVIALLLAERCSLGVGKHAVLATALLHDAEEAVTGDLPALAKRGTPGWKDTERAGETELFDGVVDLLPFRSHLPIVKLADRMASLLYATDEVEMGNSHFLRIQRELVGEIYDMLDGFSKDVREEVIDIMMDLDFDKSLGVEQVSTISHL